MSLLAQAAEAPPAGGADPGEAILVTIAAAIVTAAILGPLFLYKRGRFEPPGHPAKLPDYQELQDMVAGAREQMKKFTPEIVNGLEGADVTFVLGERKLPFTAVGFLSSFSLPNFYFHAATAYDILRSRGVPVGKRDFLGRLRMKEQQ